MGKVLYSASMSLDGSSARVGALLVGYRPFRGDDLHKGTPSEDKPAAQTPQPG
jgi:hypothetical protein